MTTSRLLASLVFVFLIAVVPSRLCAQSAQVSGQVLDQVGGGVESAALTLTRSDTGDRRETLTTKEGYYTFPGIQPGSYELKVQKEGFSSYTQSGVTVQTGQVSAINVTLSLGTVNQSVNVEADAPQLQTETAAVAHIVDSKTITDMPLLDRRSSQLQRLNGFVVGNGTGGNATFAIAGGRGNNANYLIDGGNAQNLLLGVPTLSFDPPVESVQEFNVSISNYEAELGRTGGGVIQMTTKSGTNDFHMSAYEFFRNDALNARTFFAATNPELRYNLFGASIGGPIKRNKTLFFFNYEGRRQINSPTVVQNVPSAAEKAGDFSDIHASLKDAQGRSLGAVIPSNLLDPVGLKLASYYPDPNVPGAAPGKANFVANDPANTVVDAYVARIDHTFNDNNRIYGRLLAQTDQTNQNSVFPVYGTDAYGYRQHDYYYNASATWLRNISPTTVNEARFTYSRRQYLIFSGGANNGLGEQLAIANVDQNYFPTVAVNGYAQIGYAQQQRLQTPIRSDQYADNLTILRGTHQIKFGIEYRYTSNIDHYSPSAGGSFTFSANGTGNALASLLLGYVNKETSNETYAIHSRADSYGAYIQDDWHVTSNFTLNVGLRYDVDSPRRETSNRQNSFNTTAINPVSGTPGIITFSGIDADHYANQWDLDNFGPRVGFAWNLKHDWVIRGGGALLYLPEYDSATPTSATTGFATQSYFVSPDNGKTPAFLLRNGVPAVNTPALADLTPGFGAVPVGQTPTTAVSFFEGNRITGYLYQASLDVQHQFAGNLLVDIGYLGTFGHHLASPDERSIDQVDPSLLGPGNMQVLRPFPQFSNVSIISDDIGNSNYHGVNIGVEKRYSKGLQFRGNYTFAKQIDDLDSRNELAAFPGTNAFANFYNRSADRGLSGNDIRHRFVLSSVYDLPFGHGRRFASKNGLVDTVAGGWSLGVIAELRSGTPLSAVELNNNTGSFSDGVRPNVVGDAGSLSSSRSKAAQLAEWFNVNAFAAPAQYTFGNAGRSFGEGPGAISVDTSLLKDFKITERGTLQFRAEGLNILNHANFANPDTRQGSPTFGQVTSLVSGNQARILQLGIHLQF
jgi:Carboxypeptidase regulatory-like domain/TonB dependent receptor